MTVQPIAPHPITRHLERLEVDRLVPLKTRIPQVRLAG